MVTGPERSSAAAPMSRREALRLGVGSAVASVAGCLDAIRGADPDHEWPTFARDAANTGATSARGPDEPAELWTAEIGPVYGTPTVVDDTVYAIG